MSKIEITETTIVVVFAFWLLIVTFGCKKQKICLDKSYTKAVCVDSGCTKFESKKIKDIKCW